MYEGLLLSIPHKWKFMKMAQNTLLILLLFFLHKPISAAENNRNVCSNLVKKLPKFMGKTQMEYARMIGISPRVLIDFERGVGNPTLASIQSMIDSLTSPKLGEYQSTLPQESSVARKNEK